MRKYSIREMAAVALVLFTILIGHTQAANAAPVTFVGDWVPKADLMRPRGEHATVVINRKMYVLGGLHDHRSGPAAVDMYTPSTRTWKQVSTLPLNRHHFNAAVYGWDIWVVGGKTGGDTTGTKRVDIYNAPTNKWRSGPVLPEMHWGGPSVVVGDKLHVLTGTKGNVASFVTAHHLVLDLKNQSLGSQSLAPVPRPRVHAGAVAIKGKIYLVGGEIAHAHTGDRTDVQIYNPVTDIWSVGRSLPIARSHVDWNTLAFRDSILSISGVDSSKTPRAQAEMYQYFPSTNQWVRLADLPRKLASPGAAIVNDVLYVSGGGVNDWFGVDPITGKKMTTLWSRKISAAFAPGAPVATKVSALALAPAPIPLPAPMLLLVAGIASLAAFARVGRGGPARSPAA